MFKYALGLIGFAVAFALMSPSHKAGGFSDSAKAADTQGYAVDASGRAIEKAPDQGRVGNGFASNTIQRSPDGHFYLDAMVNGASVHFLIDTGASTVALTKRDAQAAGVQFASGEFNTVGQGAGGAVAMKSVTLDRVAAGALEAHNVDAVVIDSDLSVSLLGQSWLRQVGTVSIEGDTMTLR